MSQHWYSKEGDLVDPFTKGAYPSVTTIQDVAAKDSLDDAIARLGDDRFKELMEHARERGTLVHQACEDHIKGVTPGDMSDEVAQYYQGFLNWEEAVRPTYLHSEMFLRSDKYKFSGTADIVCLIDGATWLIDIKTTSMHKKEHGIQVKAYQQAYFEMRGERPHTAILKLTDKTKKGWQWKVYDEPFKPFLGLLNYFVWTVRKRKPVVVTDVWEPEDMVLSELAK